MRTAIVIPARYASQRLPGKPLLRETGKYLIEHVYERASQARCASTVIVATDDLRIVEAVQSFGGQVVMTRSDHPSGTDRVAEAAQSLDVDVIVNLQGDEPLIEPSTLDLLAEMVHENPDAALSTLAVPIQSREQWLDPNCVKVVSTPQGKALYFSRSPIPHVRDGEPDFSDPNSPFFQHLGLYAYRRSFLFDFAAMEPHPWETCEKLEQLRALGHGYTIQVGVVQEAASGVDTPEDYRRFVERMRRAA